MGVSKRTVWIAVIAALGAAAWFFWPSGGGFVANAPPSNPTIVMLGDSMTAGAGASKGQDLPAQLGRRIGRRVVNDGVSGDTTGDALRRIDTILESRPGTVIVFLGGNDRLQRQPLTETESNLVRIIERLQGAGAMVVLVGFAGLPGDGYGSMLERVARRHGCLFVPDALDGIFFNPAMKSDQIHPNDKGYALIAERIAERLQPYLAGGS